MGLGLYEVEGAEDQNLENKVGCVFANWNWVKTNLYF